MPREPQTLLFVGIRNSVVALDERTGTEVWRAALRGSDFVTVLWDGEALIVANRGEVSRLDPRTGSVMWHNELKGLGRGLVTLASARAPQSQVSTGVTTQMKERRDRAAEVAATSAAIQ
jgi:outer membrane protein assembly factor BamB